MMVALLRLFHMEPRAPPHEIGHDASVQGEARVSL